MRCTTRFVYVASLALLAACSDDGLTVQDLNSSSTAADNASADETGNATSGAVETFGQDGQDSSGGTGPASTTSEPTTGPAATDSASDTNNSESEGTTGGVTEGSSTEGGTTGEPCEPINPDGSGIGIDCRSDLDCLEGYTCQPFVGFAFQQTCQILCAQTCECPAGLTCNETVDKTGVPWFQCG